jgi:hypothetical protein
MCRTTVQEKLIMLRKILSAVFCTMLLCSPILSQAVPAPTPAVVSAPDLTGLWVFDVFQDGQKVDTVRVTLQQNGNKITGTSNEILLNGSIENDIVNLDASRADAGFVGKVRIESVKMQLKSGKLKGTFLRDDSSMSTFEMHRATQADASKPNAPPPTTQQIAK